MNDITLTAQQAAQIDKQAKEYLGIQALVLMENAGRGVAEAVLDLIGRDRDSRIALFCGRGNNAGDGFVTARHLIAKGQDVDVYLCDGFRMESAPLHPWLPQPIPVLSNTTNSY